MVKRLRLRSPYRLESHGYVKELNDVTFLYETGIVTITVTFTIQRR